VSVGETFTGIREPSIAPRQFQKNGKNFGFSRISGETKARFVLFGDGICIYSAARMFIALRTCLKILETVLGEC